MASLVAYDDSDSEAEEAGRGGSAAGRAAGASGLAGPGVPDASPKGAQGAGAGQCRLPRARLWAREPGCGPSARLRWPGEEPAGPAPPWARCAPAVPAAARRKQPRPLGLPMPPPGTQARAAAACGSRGPQSPGAEGRLVPYIPKRLRQQPADPEPAGASAPSAPAPLCLAPGVSEAIRPHLSSPRRETRVPRTVRSHLWGHKGPVHGIQWCPVLASSQLLLSASTDKTFKVWDAVDSGRCLQTYSLHSEAVRAAQWSPCGRRILSGGFDFALHLTDLETGTQLFSGRSDFRITTLKFYPKDHNIFLCGGFSSEIKAWDVRTGKVVRGYKATIQQTLDILFLQEGSEFLSSTDASTRDSADRTIIAWDFRTSAKISNQIFHERYTCPSLALHPREPVFLAQTNGNYLALFSAVWPYRMSRRRRYEGHKVEGYAVGCECSPCGDLLVTGSADGRVLMFSFRTASRACTLQGHTQACVGTTYHPVLPSVLGTCSWGGDIKIWH
ncbi:WD repeat-containing protein 25 [Heterocephalus glaber]|uniref:WD repeat-containing protein 25 n=1 Tax=Heterocephalus glaber TaxID=10181 RepID=A0AAX6S7B1_HETGA|nr:WD repeat-containing protein 25 [Heterocephalus glaber]